MRKILAVIIPILLYVMIVVFSLSFFMKLRNMLTHSEISDLYREFLLKFPDLTLAFLIGGILSSVALIKIKGDPVGVKFVFFLLVCPILFLFQCCLIMWPGDFNWTTIVGVLFGVFYGSFRPLVHYKKWPAVFESGSKAAAKE